MIGEAIHRLCQIEFRAPAADRIGFDPVLHDLTVVIKRNGAARRRFARCHQAGGGIHFCGNAQTGLFHLNHSRAQGLKHAAVQRQRGADGLTAGSPCRTVEVQRPVVPARDRENDSFPGYCIRNRFVVHDRRNGIIDLQPIGQADPQFLRTDIFIWIQCIGYPQMDILPTSRRILRGGDAGCAGERNGAGIKDGNCTVVQRGQDAVLDRNLSRKVVLSLIQPIAVQQGQPGHGAQQAVFLQQDHLVAPRRQRTDGRARSGGSPSDAGPIWVKYHIVGLWTGEIVQHDPALLAHGQRSCTHLVFIQCHSGSGIYIFSSGVRRCNRNRLAGLDACLRQKDQAVVLYLKGCDGAAVPADDGEAQAHQRGQRRHLCR